jgi:hypothetical protein
MDGLIERLQRCVVRRGRVEEPRAAFAPADELALE